MRTVNLSSLEPGKKFRWQGRYWRTCRDPFYRQFVGGCAIEFIPVETTSKNGSNFVAYLHGCEAVQIKG